jgi:DNA-binding NarL/FixJ family response regulator
LIRVLLVNEIRLVSNVIAAVLEDETDMKVVGRVSSAEQALALASECDVVVMDSRLPDDGARRLIEALAESHPSVKTVVLGLAESPNQVLPYVEAGAAGYVRRDDPVDELLERIRAAHNDKALVSPEIAGALVSRVSELAQILSQVEPGVARDTDLTPREREILALLAQDLTNQEIADRLFIQVGTVKNHVHSILQKLDVNNRSDAAAFFAFLDD